jgi:hypothetical protein
VPHPSAPNAYPSAPNSYPSGPDTVEVVDQPTGSYTGAPTVTVAIGVAVADPATGTARTGTPTGGANRSVADTVSGNRTGNTPAIAAQGSFIFDTPTSGDRYGLPGADATADTLVVDLVQPTFRTGLSSATVEIGVEVDVDVVRGHYTGAPNESLLLGWVWLDTTGASLTGLPPAAAAVDIFAPPDTPGGNSRTGTPYEGPGVTRIWRDVSTGSYTVSQSSIYAVQIVDRLPGATGSYTVLTAGSVASVGFPLPDPRTVTIRKDDGTPFGALVPASIVPPSGKPPRYRLYIYSTVTGRIAYELPFQNVSWGQALNDIGNCSATVQVDEFYDAVSDQDERSPKTLFGQFLTGQYVYSMALTYGNTVVWAGPYSACMIPTESPTVQIGGAEFASLLAKRLLVRGNPPAENSDITLGPVTKPYLAYKIVDVVTKGGMPHTLPWTCSDVPDSVGDVIRNYWGYDLRTAWDALSELAQEKEGPDFRFDPIMSQRSDGNYITFDMKIGRPLLANPTVWGWDCPTNAQVGWSVSVENVASQYFATGAGQDRDRLIAIANSDALLKAGGPGIELVDDLHSSTTIQSNLQKFADADIELYDHPVATWLIQVQASGDPLLGAYRCGDTVQVRIEDHAVIPNGVYTRRITSLSGGSSDYVAIGSSDDYVVQSTTSNGVQIVSSGG